MSAISGFSVNSSYNFKTDLNKPILGKANDLLMNEFKNRGQIKNTHI